MFPARDWKATVRPSALIVALKLGLSPWTPPGPTLTRSVEAVSRSRTKTSQLALVSSGTRFVASDPNATNRPSALIAGKTLAPSASIPALSTLTRSVDPVARSRTNTSEALLLSSGTRLVAFDVNATYRPSALIAGDELSPTTVGVIGIGKPGSGADGCACSPALLTLTRSVLPDVRSRTKTSYTRFVSPGTRLVAPDTKATYRPSALTTPPLESAFPSSPTLLTLTRSVVL